MSPLPNYSRGILREKGPEISPPGEGGRLVNGGRDSSQASWPPVQRIGFLFWIIESHSHYRSPPSDSPRHQIVGFLREAETGLPVKHLCRTHGFSEASYYLWRSKFGGMSVSDAGRARERVQQYRAVGLTRTSPVPLAELASTAARPASRRGRRRKPRRRYACQSSRREPARGSCRRLCP